MKILLLAFLIFNITLASAQDHRYDPPWNKLPDNGSKFTVPGIDNVPDLFGDINNPDLVVFCSGNEFMVMDELLVAFKKAYPAYKKIFVETLPPGVLTDQIKSGALTMGNMRIDLKPDVFTGGKTKIDQTPEWFSRQQPYCKNKLAIMVQKGNPKKINGLSDLGRKEIRISMPNPEWEAIGKRIEESYIKAGGESLKTTIMQAKVKDGSTFLTQIHHRQSPMRILYGESDAAPVWFTEVNYQKNFLTHPVDIVEIPAQENIEALSIAAVMKNAPHPRGATDFVNFLASEAGQAIFKKYGFGTLADAPLKN